MDFKEKTVRYSTNDFTKDQIKALEGLEKWYYSNIFIESDIILN